MTRRDRVMLAIAYLMLIGTLWWGANQQQVILDEIEDQNCALAGLELVATEFLLRPDTESDDDLERRYGLILAELEELCESTDLFAD